MTDDDLAEYFMTVGPQQGCDFGSFRMGYRYAEHVAALAQQQEPVAWLVQYDDETRSGSFVTMSLDDAELYCAEDKEIVPLYP